MSKERANVMLRVWQAGRSNIPERYTEEFQRQYDLAISDDPWAFVPSIAAFGGVRCYAEQRAWYERVCATRKLQ